MFSNLRTALRAIGKDRRGITALEYGLLAAVLGVAIVAAATTLGSDLKTAFTNIGAKLEVK